jgi:hypothetical protein
MMDAGTARKINNDIALALGLNPEKTAAITITLDANSYPTVTVQQIISPDDAVVVANAIARYRLVEVE